MTQDEASKVAFLLGLAAEVVVQITIAVNPAAKEIVEAFKRGELQ